MNYLKKALLIALGVLILVGITAGIYGIITFREKSVAIKQKTKEEKEINKLYDSTISFSSQKCDFPDDSSTATYSAVIRSSNPAEVHRVLAEEAKNFNGLTVVSTTNALGYDAKAKMNVDTFYVGLLFPLDQKDEYLKRVKKIASAPNEIENEYLNFLSLATLKQECQYNLEEVKNLSIKEKMLLDQLISLKEENIIGGEWSAVFNDLARLRQDAANFTRNLDSFASRRLNKFEVNLTIQNFPG